jgi:uncharacterized protein (TIGR00369 family)
MNESTPHTPTDAAPDERPDAGLLAHMNGIPMVQYMGFDIVKAEGGESEVLYTVRPQHLNNFGLAHGGALLALMDMSMAAAARSMEPEGGVVTVELKTSFMRGGTGSLRGRGRLLHRTASLAFVEASILDAQDRLCAHATGTFKYRKYRTPQDAAPAAAPGAPTTD